MVAAQTQSTKALLARLRELRLHASRQPEEVVGIGLELERRGTLSKASGEVWDAVEQVAIAATETGQTHLAKTLIASLTSHFSSSTPHRSTYLSGVLKEAEGDLAGAREHYEMAIREDETDVASRKRLIALHLSSPILTLPDAGASSYKALSSSIPASQQPYLAASLSRQKGIHILVHYLDTYYADLTAWLSLASAYASLALYPQALSALAHALVLAPNDPWVALKYAETVYTAGDVHTAWKEFCRVVEMSTEEGDATPLQGAARRAAMGAKLCLPRLRALPSPSDPLLAPAKLDALDLVFSSLLLDAYSKTEGAVGAGVVRKWIGGAVEA
ncbi:tetratricopeptide repeat protein [Rhodotorula paludigena]|uniref:tetratricopeptide repeat protein n=1 Tax=Rhodotorula paludigena TaxID=86838 RepID=UPI00317938CC